MRTCQCSPRDHVFIVFFDDGSAIVARTVRLIVPPEEVFLTDGCQIDWAAKGCPSTVDWFLKPNLQYLGAWL